MNGDLAELFRWRVDPASVPAGEAVRAWTDAADQAGRLLAEVDAGRVEATPVEAAALRTFVATVQGMRVARLLDEHGVRRG